MRSTLALTALHALFAAVMAGPPDTVWTRAYGGSGGDMAYHVTEASDGGYLVTGFTIPDFWEDAWLLRLDRSGDTVWTRAYGGSNAERTSAVVEVPGGYMLAGGYLNVSTFECDGYAVRADLSGDTVWTRVLGGPGYDEFYSAVASDDGGIVACGRTAGDGEDAWLVRLDSLGDTVWTRRFGGSGSQNAFALARAADGGYLLAGSTNAAGPDQDYYLVRTDSAGDTLWTRSYSRAGAGLAYALCPTRDGGCALVGTQSDGNGTGVLLVRVDADGDTLWTRACGGAGAGAGWSVQETPDHGFIISGTTSSGGNGDWDFWLARADSAGDTLWTATHGGPSDDGLGYGLQTRDGGYILAGWTASYGAGEVDAWLVRLSAETGTAEVGPGISPRSPSATLVREALRLPASPMTRSSSLITAAGRKVLDLKPGDNDVSNLAPGVYFVDAGTGMARILILR